MRLRLARQVRLRTFQLPDSVGKSRLERGGFLSFTRERVHAIDQLAKAVLGDFARIKLVPRQLAVARVWRCRWGRVSKRASSEFKNDATGEQVVNQST